MTRELICTIGLVAGIAIAGAAQAQVAGTFTGQSADGSSITMVITESGGVFSVATTDVNVQGNCRHPDRIVDEGWGFYLGQPIVSGDNNFHSGNDYYDVRVTFHFDHNKTIKGMVASATSVFVPGADPPAAAQFCSSARQAFELHWQSAPQAKPVAPGTVVSYRW